MKKNIYPVKSQRVNEIFNSNPDWSKILVVPVDFAKKEHTVQFCLGTGVYLLNKALRIYNKPSGFEYFKERLEKTMKRHNILKENVLIVSEDPPGYIVNFIHHARSFGYAWMRVNAKDAKKLRRTIRASSDSIDLTGIAQSLLNRRAREVEEFDEIYHAMKHAARTRRKFVRDETSAKNRIHACADILFPGFLKESNTGIVPFGEASLGLMEEHLSPAKIKRMRLETLITKLRKRRADKPAVKAAKLKKLAESVLSPPEDVVAYHQCSLIAKVAHLRAVRGCIEAEENEMARCLAQTTGFYLTSIPGIGVPLAGHITAELGEPTRWLSVDNTASYAGIVCRQSQTGGADSPPVKGGLPLDCNHVFKDYLLQAAHHVGTTPMAILKELSVDDEHTLYKHHLRLTNRNARSRLGTAKKFLKIARCLMSCGRSYLPIEWVDYANAERSVDDVRLFFEFQLETLKRKWMKYDLKGIDPEKNYYLKEEKAINEALEHNKNL